MRFESHPGTYLDGSVLRFHDPKTGRVLSTPKEAPAAGAKAAVAESRGAVAEARAAAETARRRALEAELAELKNR